jgi:hypothetical protein
MTNEIEDFDALLEKSREAVRKAYREKSEMKQY